MTRAWRELPFQDSEETREARRLIRDAFGSAQELVAAALVPGGENRFDWFGRPYVVDRRRCLVLAADDRLAWTSDGTLDVPDDDDVVSLFGGDGRVLDVPEVLDVLAWTVAGVLDEHGWFTWVTHMLNMLAAQPLVNPAAAPLFWVALNAGLGEHWDFGALMRPMTFDMAAYPASRAAAAKVRWAQIDFVRTWRPETDLTGAERLDDEAWADVCTRVVDAAKYGIESHVLEVVARQAELIRSGALRL